MKKLLLRLLASVAAACFFLVFFTAVSAGERAGASGEVIYRQDFGVCDTVLSTGMEFGTLSSPLSTMWLTGESLAVSASHGERTYLILPTVTDSDSYTFEVTMRVTDWAASNAYVGLLTSGWGTEPRNRTELLIRQAGLLEDFGAPTSAISAAIADGESFTVRIAVRSGMLYEATVSAGGRSETVTRDGIKSSPGGTVGLSIRYASVEVSEIVLAHGTDFEEYSGLLAENSYSELYNGGQGSDTGTSPPSPPTGDIIIVFAALTVAFAAAGGMLQLRKRR